MTRTRDDWGRVVREAWVTWAKTQPNPKPSWLVPYDELSEADKEADRQIAEAVLEAAVKEASERGARLRQSVLVDNAPGKRVVPFAADEVESLNAFQTCGELHPFTCGNDSQHANLVASESGWSCPDCDYRQDWAHDWIADGRWRQTTLAAVVEAERQRSAEHARRNAENLAHIQRLCREAGIEEGDEAC